jgi:hypothetical protein
MTVSFVTANPVLNPRVDTDLEARIPEAVAHSLQARTIRNATVLATFEDRTAPNTPVALGVYRGLDWLGFCMNQMSNLPDQYIVLTNIIQHL